MTRTESLKAVRLFAVALAITAFGCDDEMMPDAGPPLVDSGPRPSDAGTDAGPPLAADIAVTPPLSDFGDIIVGADSTPVAITVTNSGTGPTNPLTMNLGGGDAGAFSTSGDTCTGTRLDPTETCTVNVTFSPTSLGAAAATLTASDGSVTAIATLEGNGLDPAALSVGPSPVNFGPNTVGVASAARTLTVTNGGDEVSGTIAVALGGLDATQFTISNDTCTGMTLAAMGTCTLDVTYLPTTEAAHMGTVDVSASPGSTASATLMGTAATPPSLLLLPGTQNFGTVVTGSSSTDIMFTLRNTGGLATGNINHVFSGPDMLEFDVVTSTCLGAPLVGGATCNITVRFNAGVPGAKTASLDVDDGGGVTAVSALTATSQAPGLLTIMPSANDFLTSPVGVATASRTFTITNTGGSTTGPISVAISGADAADFPLVGASDLCSGNTLLSLATCTVAVRFNPVAAGSRAADLRVTGTPGGTTTSSLTGFGEAPAQIEILPPAADFGGVAVGAASGNIAFTVRNNGAAMSGVPIVQITGPLATQFMEVSNGCTAALPGGGTCTYTVRFLPTSLLLKTAVITATATPGGMDASDIIGTGISPAAISFDPAGPFAFGPVAETESAERTIIVRNSGAETADNLVPTITGPGTAQYSIQPGGTCGGPLATASTCTVIVRFTPSGQAAASATLTVTGTPGGVITSALSGTGIADILLTHLTGGTNFAMTDQLIGDTGTATFRFTNQTTRTLTSFTVVSPPTTAGLEFRTTASGCTATLLSGATCDITVTYIPAGLIGPRMVPLTATGSGGATETRTITSNANGPLQFTSWTSPLGGPTVTFPANFGDTVVGSVVTATMLVTNNGATTLTEISTQTAFSGEMQIVGDTCSGGTPLTPGGTCVITIRFYPQNIGGDSGTVTLSYDAISEAAMVIGNGITAGTISSSGDNSFSRTIATQTRNQTYTVTNLSGTEPTAGVLTYSLTPGTRFTIVAGGTCPASGARVLAPSEACTIVVRFSPLASDDTTDTLTDTLNITAGNTANRNLTGTVSSQLTLTPTNPTFITGIGSASPPQTFTVNNVGSVVTALLTINVVGTGAGEFVLSNNLCGSIAAGGNCTFAYTYNASATARSVDLQVSSGTYIANIANNDNTTLTGTPQSPANLVVTQPARVDYGFVLNGANTGTYRYTVTNIGTLTSGTITTAVALNPLEWTVSNDTCNGSTLVGGASCTYDVAFTPPAAPPNFNLVLGTFASSATPGGVAMGLGRGGSVPMATAQGTMTPVPHSFGSSPAGTPVAAVTFTAFNDTAATRTVGPLGPAFVDDTGTPIAGVVDFTIVANGAGACTAGAMIPAAGSCTFTVSFTPPAATAFGFHQRWVEVFFVGAAGNTSARTAVNGISLEANTIALSATGGFGYGSVGITQSATKTFTAQNTGDVTSAAPTITITGAVPGDYTISGDTCSGNALDADETCTFDLTFSPTGAGARNATVTFNAGAGLGTVMQGVTGNGLAAPILGITPTGTQICTPSTFFAGNSSSSCVEYTITNGGGVSVGLNTAVTTGEYRRQSHGGACTGTTTLTPSPTAGSSCTLRMRHSPRTVGVHAGTVTVSAPGIASVAGAMTATGVEAFNHTGSAPATPSLTQFANAAVDAGGNEKTFTFTNQSSPTSGIMEWTITGANADEFDVTGDTCTGSPVASGGGTCTITVRFLPTAAGSRAATLTVSDGTAMRTAAVAMTGTGT